MAGVTPFDHCSNQAEMRFLCVGGTFESHRSTARSVTGVADAVTPPGFVPEAPRFVPEVLAVPRPQNTDGPGLPLPLRPAVIACSSCARSPHDRTGPGKRRATVDVHQAAPLPAWGRPSSSAGRSPTAAAGSRAAVCSARDRPPDVHDVQGKVLAGSASRVSDNLRGVRAVGQGARRPGAHLVGGGTGGQVGGGRLDPVEVDVGDIRDDEGTLFFDGAAPGRGQEVGQKGPIAGANAAAVRQNVAH